MPVCVKNAMKGNSDCLLYTSPLGELLEPSGTLAFEEAVSEYARIVRAGAAAGADLIFFETFTDL